VNDEHTGGWLRRQAGTLLRFASVGVLATLVHAAVYTLCIALTELHAQAANFCGYAIALLVSWAGQRHWTFAHVANADGTSAKFRFLATSLLGYLLNAAWVALVTGILGIAEYYALVGIVFVTPGCIFLLLKFWVFVDESRSAD